MCVCVRAFVAESHAQSAAAPVRTARPAMSWLKKRLRRLVGLKSAAKVPKTPVDAPPVTVDDHQPEPEQSNAVAKQQRPVSTSQLTLALVEEEEAENDEQQEANDDKPTNDSDAAAVVDAPRATACRLPVKVRTGGSSFRSSHTNQSNSDNNNTVQRDNVRCNRGESGEMPQRMLPLSDRCWAIAPGPAQVVATKMRPPLMGKLPRLDRVRPAEKEVEFNSSTCVCVCVCESWWGLVYNGLGFCVLCINVKLYFLTCKVISFKICIKLRTIIGFN